MGLVLSVLVVCVGVYKFIQIYSDTGRIVSYGKQPLCPTDNVSKNSETDLSAPRVKLCRDFLSHEDVEIECKSRVLTQDLTGTSSRRFLVTEKDDETSQHSRTPSPRKFLITRENENNSNLREFLLAKGKPKDNSNTERFVLIDTRQDFKDVSPLPLPKQFVITQESSSIDQERLQTFKEGIGIGLNSLTYMGESVDNINDLNLFKKGTVLSHLKQNSSTKENGYESYSETLTTTHKSRFEAANLQEAQISSSILQIYDNTPEEFHRDASPYPSLDVSKRKGSIGLDMLDKAKVNMDEVDEESDSATAKVGVITKTGDFNTTEYSSNQVLVIQPGHFESANQADEVSTKMKNQNLDIAQKDARSKSASRPEIATSEELRRVNSSSKMYDKDFQEPSGLFINVLKRGGDEEFRNSLDGVKRGSEARRSFKKKKNRSQNSLENGESHGNDNEEVDKPTTSENTRVNTKTCDSFAFPTPEESPIMYVLSLQSFKCFGYVHTLWSECYVFVIKSS